MAESPPNNNQRAADMRRAAQNISVLMLASILSKGILFGWSIILTNLISPADNGILATVLALGGVAAPIVNFGIGLIAIREVSRKPELAGQYWTAMLFTQTLLFIVAYIAMVIGAVLVGNSAGNPDIMAYAAIAGLSLLIDVLGSITNDLLIAQERMTVTAAVDIGTIIIRVGLVALAITSGWGILGLYLMTILSGIIRMLILWSIHWRDGLRPQFPLDRKIARFLLMGGWPLAINAVIAQFFDQSDKIMTTSIIGETATGYLSPAFTIKFGIVELLSTTVVLATYPIMSRYHQEGDGSMFGFMVEKLARFMLLVSLPIALVFTLFSAPIIALIFNPDYAPTAGIMPIFIWYTVFAMVAAIFGRALLIQNRQRTALLIRISALVLNVILNLILLFAFRDPRGAAIATVVAEALSLGLMMWVFRATGFDWNRALTGAGRILALGVVCALVMLMLGSLHYLIGIAGGLIFYVIAVMMLPILDHEDWDLLYRVASALPMSGIILRYWQRDLSIKR